MIILNKMVYFSAHFIRTHFSFFFFERESEEGGFKENIKARNEYEFFFIITEL